MNKTNSSLNSAEDTVAALADFLVQFDEYVAVRATLRDMADGSDDERYCIADCAERWNRLVLARERIKP